MSKDLMSLIGEHVLTGVDESNERVKSEWGDDFENCQVMNFVLDGVTYTAIEDPSDGYRSSMREFKITQHIVKNIFPPVSVVCIKKPRDYGENETLQMICIENGKVVLEVGTDNSEDYYPSFVAAFSPQNMPVNTPPDAKEPR